MKNYVGLNGPSSSKDSVFACPADTFYYFGFSSIKNGQGPVGNSYSTHSHHDQSGFDYSSYTYNAVNLVASSTITNSLTGIGGRKSTSIKRPDKTILVAESPAFWPYSWHDPKRPSPGALFVFNNAKDMLGFVDGHVSYTKMYLNSNMVMHVKGFSLPQPTVYYDPPDNYDYKWSGN